MLYVLVLIRHFSQLAVILPDLARDLEQQLAGLAASRGAAQPISRQGAFLFAFHPQRDDALGQIGDFLGRVREILDRRAEELFGYTLLVEEEPDLEPPLLLPKLKTLCYLAPEDEPVLAGPRLGQRLESSYPVRNLGDLYALDGPLSQPADPEATWSGLCARHPLGAALRARLEASEAAAASSGRPVRERWQTEDPEGLAWLLPGLLPQAGWDQALTLQAGPRHLDPLTWLQSLIDPAVLNPEGAWWSPEDRTLWAEKSQWQRLLKPQGLEEIGAPEEISVAWSWYLGLWSRREQRAGRRPRLVLVGSGEALKGVMDSMVPALEENSALDLLWLDREKTESWALKPRPAAWRVPGDEAWAGLWQRQTGSAPQAGLVGSVYEALARRREAGSQIRSEGTGAARLLAALDSLHRRVYAVAQLGAGLWTPEGLARCLIALGENAVVTGDKIETLAELGLLRLNEKVELFDESALDPAAEGLDGARVARILAEEWRKSGRRQAEAAFQVLARLGAWETAWEAFGRYLQLSQNRRSLWPRPQTWPNLWAQAPEDLGRRFAERAAAADLRQALDAGRLDQAVAQPASADPEVCLQEGRRNLVLGQIAEGFQALKTAYLTAQEQGDALVLARAGFDLGLALWARRRLDEALEYFQLGAKQAERDGSVFNWVQHGHAAAGVLFLKGRLDASYGALEAAAEALALSGLADWQAFALVLQGRLAFETGVYSGAEAVFTRLAAEDRLPSEARALGRRWIARCQIWQGRAAEGAAALETEAPGAERNVFLAEAAAWAEDWEGVLSWLRGGVPVQAEPGSWLNLSWTSAFASLEDRLASSGSGGALGSLSRALTALAQGRLGQNSLAVEAFRALLAERPLGDSDPFSPVYHYWYALILPRGEGDQEALRSTVLGRGLKELQSRSARIEDRTWRLKYLSEGRWHALYLAEARRLKLM